MTDTPSSGQDRHEIDTTQPHSARVWNYWLGGTDNFQADREVGDQVKAVAPDITLLAQADRAFLVRAITYLVSEAGIRQFLDIGSGLPTANNTHQVAQALAPESRIVYVDNDPLVLAHAGALLTSAAEGACDYVHADVRDPGKILAAAARTLDFSKPIGLVMAGILGQLPDSDDPGSIIKRLLDAVPSGSYLTISDGADTSESLREAARLSGWYHLRSPEQIAGFFQGMELVEPGVVPLSRWRPEAMRSPELEDVAGMGGVGRKP